MRLRSLFVLLLGLASSASSLKAQTLFYNGTGGDDRTLSGEFLPGQPNSGTWRLFDNFVVGGAGWNVTGLFGDFLYAGPGVWDTGDNWNTAYYEIRTGVSAAGFGTLLYAGSAAATQVGTGRTVSGQPEYRTVLTGFSFELPTGEYWMTIAPVADRFLSEFVMAGFPPFVSSAGGENSVNAILDGQAYSRWSFAPNPLPQSGDYAYGVIGTQLTAETPEPATWALLLTGLLAVAAGGHRRTRRAVASTTRKRSPPR